MVIAENPFLDFAENDPSSYLNSVGNFQQNGA